MRKAPDGAPSYWSEDGQLVANASTINTWP